MFKQGRKEWTHFVGIGGVGMSGLARILLDLNHHVSGSDLKSSKTIEMLKEKGAKIYEGHHPANLEPQVSEVVISSAIPANNPEVKAARRRGLPVIKRADLLARFIHAQKALAVSGTHGKTTTSSMLALVLEKSGLDPTIIVGGKINDLGCNAKLGKGPYLVAEADESDGSFLKFYPYAAIITNVEDDHLDYYQSVSNLEEAFIKFAQQVSADGFLIIPADDSISDRISKQAAAPCYRVGVEKDADYQARDIHLTPGGSFFRVYFRGESLGTLDLKVVGLHNVRNALAAAAAGHRLGLDFSTVAQALQYFQGVGRRFQLQGEQRGVKVIDDYAHHPTEIKALLRGARQLEPSRLLVIFQPHRFTRTKHLYRQFGEAFEDADLVVVTDIYSGGEQPIPGISPHLVVEAIKQAGGPEVVYLPSLENSVRFLGREVREGDLILTVGAGDVWRAGSMLLLSLSALSEGKELL